MHIKRLELRNFRAIGHAVFEDLPDCILLVSPNGRGKSSVLEAIAGAKDLVVPYHRDDYQFKETWQQRHVSVWPQHLADPIKIGERRAEINLEVEATGNDCDYLRSSGITEMVGTAQIVIEDGRRISDQKHNDTARKLFQFHGLAEGVGFVDYIRSVRFFNRREIGNFSAEMTDDHLRQNFGNFHRPESDQQKFDGFKSFVVSSQLNDFSHQQMTDEKIDSLAQFRKVFDHFFSPKKFVGFRSASAVGQGRIVVESPFGSHDTDALSDGEKEMLHILAHLFRLRFLSNVVLWDTPESHLNAALESRLYDAIRQIAPSNQCWIATHSLELINAVPLENVFVLKQNGTSTTVERASGDDRQSRVDIYREMGAQVGLQLVSTVVAFAEGKDANSDKRFLDRLVAPHLPGVNFIAGGSCENIFSVGSRANALLQDACTNGDFFAIVDRDYRNDDEVAALCRTYSDKLFVWGCHEIENLLLDPSIVFQTLQWVDVLKSDASIDSVREDLKNAAESLVEWVASDWVACELDQRFRPPSRSWTAPDYLVISVVSGWCYWTC
ncbi:MAG: AAA family ATPase [Planctomycetota bacterium]|nr:AAA family ATPase [Planctomycetota bacterium]